ncbi:MAG: beta-ketoacyl-[acyl-carrier-protein] synthase family protein [Acidobacteriota bacterium]|nr:beta-ketoacyl-[acyl-carrier-protein] synthase family protein [Acidobacteriota bacterium]
MTRRVAVTGIGVIAAPGNTRAEFWEALRAGQSAIRPMTLVPEGSLRFSNAAEVAGYRASNHMGAKEADLLDRFAQFALVAAREAVAASEFALTPEVGARMAVVTGTSTGGQTSEDQEFYSLYAQGASRIHPLTIPRTMANAGTSCIAREYGIGGPCYTVSTACASATHAIGQAFWMVRNGVADAAIAGGSEAPFSMGFLKAWEAMRIVAPDTCRPFSRDRKGLILGEGAAMLVLEPMEPALARGAKIWGEIVGFGMSSDAHHLTQPLAEGAARAMRGALLDAGIGPEAIAYINAHGTGTLANDVTEAQAIRQVFGAHTNKIAVSSTKSMHGHALGAAGALEAAATLMGLDASTLPPTANFTEIDPDCALDVISNVAREATVEWALSNSFAFGGLNAVLAFRRATR